MAMVTTILPKVIKVHRNTSMGVIFILLFLLIFCLQHYVFRFRNKHSVNFQHGNVKKT